LSFADPQSIDPGTGAISLPRTGSAVGQGVFTSADGTLELRIMQNVKRRQRRMIKVTYRKIIADPLLPTMNTTVVFSCYLVADAPVNGVTATEQINLIKGLCGLLSASTYAAVTKFIGGEQ